MLHCPQRDVSSCHVGDRIRPGTCTIHHHAGLDALPICLHRCHFSARLPVQRVRFGFDPADRDTLDELRTKPLRRPLVGVHHTRGVNCAVSGRVHGTVDVVHVQDRVNLLGLGRRQHPALHAEVTAQGPQPLILVQPLFVASNEEAAVLCPRVDLRLLLKLDAHVPRVGVQLHICVGGTKAPEHASGVPRCASRELVGLEQESA
mmetsp:Transcript_26820/g.68142  ORF Transcript_26820/g.68142 Transcript_26820/m.68142 type:complete len:204 (+) Transcript_26820:2133-2744(+)